MMKKWFCYICFLGSIAWSCNESEPLDCPDCDQDGPVIVENDQLILIASKQGDLLSEYTWQDKQMMGLYLTKGFIGQHYQDDSLAYANIKATMYGGLWILSPEEVILTKTPAVVYAYHPFKRIMDPTAMPVETMTDTEYMYGTHLKPQKSVSKGYNVASVEMKHALSMIEVYVRKDKEFDNPAIVTGVNIVPANEQVQIAVEGTLNIGTGDIKPTKYGEIVREGLELELDKVYNDSNYVRLMALPREISDNEVLLQIEIAGSTFSAALRDEHDWKQGMRNIYRITFTGETVVVDDVTILPWKDVELEGEIKDGKDNVKQ